MKISRDFGFNDVRTNQMNENSSKQREKNYPWLLLLDRSFLEILAILEVKKGMSEKATETSINLFLQMAIIIKSWSIEKNILTHHLNANRNLIFNPFFPLFANERI